MAKMAMSREAARPGYKSEIHEDLCGDARSIRVSLLAGFAAELLKFLCVSKQVFDPGYQLTGLPGAVSRVPDVLNQMAESPFVAGRSVKHQDWQPAVQGLCHNAASGTAEKQVGRRHPLLHIVNPS